MRPFQAPSHAPQPVRGLNGDCFKACVSALLNLPLTDLPDVLWGDEWNPDFFDMLEERYRWRLNSEHYRFKASFHIGILGGFTRRLPKTTKAVVYDFKDNRVLYDPGNSTFEGVDRLMTYWFERTI